MCVCKKRPSPPQLMLLLLIVNNYLSISLDFAYSWSWYGSLALAYWLWLNSIPYTFHQVINHNNHRDCPYIRQVMCSIPTQGIFTEGKGDIIKTVMGTQICV